jgi:endo-1,4-beta-D-glucanase Y
MLFSLFVKANHAVYLITTHKLLLQNIAAKLPAWNWKASQGMVNSSFTVPRESPMESTT